MTNENNTSHELMRAFRQFRNVQWISPNSAPGCTKGETVSLLIIHRFQEQHDPNGVKVSELSNLMRVSMPTVTQMINVLEARGLVVRSQDPQDKRVVRIQLSEAGRKATQLAHHVMLDNMEGLISHVGEERIVQLIGLLDEVYGYFSARAAENGQPLREDLPDNMK